MAAAFGIYVMRKPGTGLIVEVLAAVIECLLGNFFGPIIILSGIIQGLGFEAIIALKHYKKFDKVTMMADGLAKAGILKGYAIADTIKQDLEE